MAQEIKDKLDRYVVMAFGVCILIASWYLYFPHTAVSTQGAISSELAAAIASGGVIRPSGYPLYNCLGRLFTSLIPGDSIASLALLSAVFQSFAAFTLFFICFRITSYAILSFALTFSWMVYQPVMQSATEVGLFSLHHLIIVLLIYLLFWFQRKKLFTSYDSFILGLVCGLGLSHDLRIIFWFPFVLGIFIELLLSLLPREQKDRTGAILSGLICGLLPYIVLFFNGGSTNDFIFQSPATISEFFNYVFSAQSNSLASNHVTFSSFLTSISSQLPLAVAGLPLLVLYILKKRRFDAFGLILTGLLLLFFASDFNFFTEFNYHSFGTLGLYAVLALATVLGFILRARTIKLMAATAILIPTIYVVPLSLAASNARNDLIAVAELEAIVKEVSSGSVFISTEPRTSFGVNYIKRSQDRASDLILISEAALRLPNYVNSLPTHYSLFDGFDLNGKLTTKEIIEIAARENRLVFANANLKLPKGYVGLPMGVSIQVVPKTFPVRYRDIVEHLVGSCSRWPDALALSNLSRPKSEYLRQEIFLGPIRKHLAEFGDTPLAPPLHAAMRAFNRGQMARARNICKQALAKFGGEGDTKSYSASY